MKINEISHSGGITRATLRSLNPRLSTTNQPKLVRKVVRYPYGSPRGSKSNQLPSQRCDIQGPRKIQRNFKRFQTVILKLLVKGKALKVQDSYSLMINCPKRGTRESIPNCLPQSIKINLAKAVTNYQS